MPKPVCVGCQCFYRPKKNGFSLVESMPVVNEPNEEIRGKRRPEAWEPYKLWQADLWECPDCGHQIVTGFGMRPIAEHYEDEFPLQVEYHGATLVVNDC